VDVFLRYEGRITAESYAKSRCQAEMVAHATFVVVHSRRFQKGTAGIYTHYYGQFTPKIAIAWNHCMPSQPINTMIIIADVK